MIDPRDAIARRARPSGTVKAAKVWPYGRSFDWVASFTEDLNGPRWVFVLPLPPSNNALVTPVRTKGGGTTMIKTSAAKRWLKEIVPVLAVDGRRIEGPVQWSCTVYCNRITRDVSNCLKQLEDALKGLCWNDDLQVVSLQASKRITDGVERVVVEVRPALDVDEETKSRILKSKTGTKK